MFFGRQDRAGGAGGVGLSHARAEQIDSGSKCHRLPVFGGWGGPKGLGDPEGLGWGGDNQKEARSPSRGVLGRKKGEHSVYHRSMVEGSALTGARW